MTSEQPDRLTAASALARATAWEQEAFVRDSEMVAREAAHIAANPPSEGRTASGDLVRLSQYVADLLRRAAKIEASFEAISLMNAPTPGNDRPVGA